MSEKTRKLLKVILIFLIYFIYVIVVSSVFNLFGISDEIVIEFIADLMFCLGIVILYKNDLKANFIKFMEEHSITQKIIFIVKWVLILFVINIVGGIITEIFFPSSLETDGNTNSIYSLATISTFYTIFKTLVFATVAEELFFKRTIREVISNNIIFIIVSSLIYAIINIMYTDITILSVVDFLSYFMFSSVLSYIYIKNDDNIVMPMIIKFFYNLIPLTILLLGVIG